MKYRYTKYTGDLLDELDIEDLVSKLSDLLLSSGFGNPYATDDNGSEANTASATAFPSRSCRAWARGIGVPTSHRFSSIKRMSFSTLRASPSLRYVRREFLRNFYGPGPHLDSGFTPNVSR